MTAAKARAVRFDRCGGRDALYIADGNRSATLGFGQLMPAWTILTTTIAPARTR